MAVHSIAFPFPLGNIIHHIGAQCFQISKNHGRGRDAVGIVIAVNRDFFKAVNGAANAPRSLLHILHEKGIGK